MQRTLTATQLCSVNSSSFCLTPVQLWPPLLSSSQTISALLNLRNSFQQLSKVVPSLPTSAQLFLSLPCSSQLLSTTLTSAHLLSTLLNSSQLFSPLATSSTLPTSSHLRSTHLTSFTAYLNSSHLLNSGQLFSTLLTSCHKDAYTQSKLLHKASSYTGKLLHREAFIYAVELLHKASFCTEKFLYLLYRGACTQSKLLHREAFTHTASFYAEKLLHKASLCTEKLFYTHSKLLHRGAFTQSKLLRREQLLHTASFYTEKLLHKASLCTEKLLHTASFYTEKLLHRMRQNEEKYVVKATVPTFMLPLQCNLWLSAAKHKSITHAPAAAMKLDAAIPLRSAETELQNAKELHTTHNGCTNSSSKTGSRRPCTKTTILIFLKKKFWKEKSSAPRWKILLPKHQSQLSRIIPAYWAISVCKVKFYLLGYFMFWLLSYLSVCLNRLFTQTT